MSSVPLEGVVDRSIRSQLISGSRCCEEFGPSTKGFEEHIRSRRMLHLPDRRRAENIRASAYPTIRHAMSKQLKFCHNTPVGFEGYRIVDPSLCHSALITTPATWEERDR